MIGRALGHDLVRNTRSARAVMGQDTRESSGWIADRVAAGMAAVGVDVHSAGVITTPGVAYLARSRGFAAGVVISASHNPWTDNGIKVFSGDGFKLTDARELAIEKEIFALLAEAGGGGRYGAEDCRAISAGRDGAAQGVHRVAGGERVV